MGRTRTSLLGVVAGLGLLAIVCARGRSPSLSAGLGVPREDRPAVAPGAARASGEPPRGAPRAGEAPAPADDIEAPAPSAMLDGVYLLDCRAPDLIGVGSGVFQSEGAIAPVAIETGKFRVKVPTAAGTGRLTVPGKGKWMVSWASGEGPVECEVTGGPSGLAVHGRASGTSAWPAGTEMVVRGCGGLADLDADGSFYLDVERTDECALEVWVQAEGKVATSGPFPVRGRAGSDAEIRLSVPPPTALRRMTDAELDVLRSRTALLARTCDDEDGCSPAYEQIRRQLDLHEASDRGP